MGLSKTRVLPEGELGLEDGLALQPGALSDEQVVVVSLQRGFVDVEHLVPQVEGHAAATSRQLNSDSAHPGLRPLRPAAHLPSDHLTMRALLSRVSFPSSSLLALHLMVFST